ncbi:transcriptional regulator, GntR family protein [Roseobacter sp. AzwK-3b]|uniref:GntR family transcriptional regulator n=1 Tax=Roseobacter sp. AzwK-3b TaxID=351016 RepID=UPI000156933F|nr:GntR family transcriptional regulator [Roseobacter sp. AzwK-3b]EDM72324.1 transcriptional regulator, GntR family protein [Roseobacter sp. AzwK-3b]
MTRSRAKTKIEGDMRLEQKVSENPRAFRSRTSETHMRIRDAVISGKLKPGTKLKIEHLSREIGVGATPIREALSSLVSDGLVVREDQRGFRVAGISGREFDELLHVRSFVEERALRLSIERGGPEWEEGIVVALYRLQSIAPSETYDPAWEGCHREFHLALNAGSGSETLLRLCSQFFDENSRYRHLSRYGGTAPRSVTDEHEGIAEAALARDADLAVEKLMTHYNRTGKLLRQALQDADEAAD